ncbi:hypothetical protein HMPREF1569_4002 [Klebsiella oxytoca OK-1]|nr:hypothetical protein HMPREF1569_4002 [Klebsiella oxytoca OK-1]
MLRKTVRTQELQGLQRILAKNEILQKTALPTSGFPSFMVPLVQMMN